MNLHNAHVLVAAQYTAPYEGNFIASLRLLQSRFIKDFFQKHTIANAL